MKNVTINLLDYFWKKGIKPIKDRMEELKEVAFSGKYSDLSNTPNALKNPNALTFTGAVTDSYDGSNSKSVKIPSVTNNLLATQPGTALDAVQGKALDDKIGKINSNLTSKVVVTPNSNYIADGNVICYTFGNLLFAYFSGITFKTETHSGWDDVILFTINKNVKYTLAALTAFYSDRDLLRLRFDGTHIYMHYSGASPNTEFFGCVMVTF